MRSTTGTHAPSNTHAHTHAVAAHESRPTPAPTPISTATRSVLRMQGVAHMLARWGFTDKVGFRSQAAEGGGLQRPRPQGPVRGWHDARHASGGGGGVHGQGSRAAVWRRRRRDAGHAGGGPAQQACRTPRASLGSVSICEVVCNKLQSCLVFKM